MTRTGFVYTQNVQGPHPKPLPGTNHCGIFKVRLPPLSSGQPHVASLIRPLPNPAERLGPRQGWADPLALATTGPGDQWHPLQPAFGSKKSKSKDKNKGAGPKLSRPDVTINNPFGDLGSCNRNLLRDIAVDACLDEVIDVLRERPNHPASRLYDSTVKLVEARWRVVYPKPTPIASTAKQRNWLFDFVDLWSRWDVLPPGFVGHVNNWVDENEATFDDWLNQNASTITGDLTHWRSILEDTEAEREVSTHLPTIETFAQQFRRSWVNRVDHGHIRFKKLNKQAQKTYESINRYLSRNKSATAAGAKAKRRASSRV